MSADSRFSPLSADFRLQESKSKYTPVTQKKYGQKSFSFKTFSLIYYSLNGSYLFDITSYVWVCTPVDGCGPPQV